MVRQKNKMIMSSLIISLGIPIIYRMRFLSLIGKKYKNILFVEMPINYLVVWVCI